MNNLSNQILTIVSETTGIPTNLILSPSRKMEIVQARHLSMYFHRWETTLSLQAIASIHNRDQHGTIINACNAIDYDIRKNTKLQEQFNHIKQYIKSVK
jgi:chromosomal replication initiator protein